MIKIQCVILLTLLFVCGNLFAYKSIGTRSIALGDSLTGKVQANESIYNNPAAMAYTNEYSLEGGYVGGGRTLAVSILDTKTATIGGGFGYYNRVEDTDAGERNDHSFKLAYGKAITSYLAFGLSGSYLMSKVAGEKKTNWNMDLGTMVVPWEFIQFGVNFKNLIKDKEFLRFQVISFGGSLNFRNKIIFTYSFDRLLQTSRGKFFNHSLGLEGVLPQNISLRGGFLIDAYLARKYWSTGLGWSSNTLALNYAFKNTVSGAADPVHSFSAAFMF